MNIRIREIYMDIWIQGRYMVIRIQGIYSELKTLEWDILNPDRIINLEIKNEWRTSNI